MNTIPCDIVILPSDDLKLKTIDLSKTLQSKDTLYTLDGINTHPHASLYMVQLNIKDIESIKQILAEIASKHKTIKSYATTYYQAMGYIDVEYQKTLELIDLQSTAVNAINPFRDGMREKDKSRMETAAGLALYNYQTYGYKYVGELFRPHVSITRFKDEASIDTSNLPNLSEFNGTFAKLCLFEMGDNGTCIREIASFNLA